MEIVHLNHIFLPQVFLYKSLVSLLHFLLSFTVRNRGPLMLHTCFFYSVEWNQVVSSSRFIFFVFLSFKMLPSLSSNNLVLFFVLPSFQKMEPSFTRVHIVLWQVFRLLISFFVLCFCLSKQWNQVFQVTTCWCFSCFSQQWNQL